MVVDLSPYTLQCSTCLEAKVIAETAARATALTEWEVAVRALGGDPDVGYNASEDVSSNWPTKPGHAFDIDSQELHTTLESFKATDVLTVVERNGTVTVSCPTCQTVLLVTGS